MEKPLTLKIIGIVTVIIAVIELLVLFYGMTELGKMLWMKLLMEFICGMLMLISGIELLKGKKKGRLFLILTAVSSIITYVMFYQISNYLLISPLVLLFLLYFLPSVKNYFNNYGETEEKK